MAPQENIRIVNSGWEQISRRISSNENYTSGADQFRNWHNEPKQFHYTFTEGTDKSLGIFIPNTGGPCRLFINGLLGDGCTELEHHSFLYGSHGLYKELDQSYLNGNRDRIDLILSNDSNHIGIREMYIGDNKLLAASFTKHNIWLQFNAFLQIFLGALIFVIGVVSLFFNQKKIVSLLICTFGLLYLSGFFIDLIPNRFVLPVLLCTVAGLLWGNRTTGNNRSVLIGFGFLALFSLMSYFLLLGSAFNPVNSQFFYGLASWGMIPMVLTIGSGELLQGKNSYYERIEQLQNLVAEKSEDIKRKEVVLNEALQKKAILEERQRFTRDIHDGIGSNLLSLLVRLRSNKINLETVQEEVESSMHDLRLVVDSLDHTGDDLSSMLITFKSRIDPQFVAAGIQLDWETEENLLWKPQKTRDILNLYRLIQEAISNILRHAQAKHVTVKVSQDVDGNLELLIEDDGIGLPNDLDELHGKGLKNMQFRAKRLNGDLKMQGNEDGQGTRISLKIPQYGDSALHSQTT